jgi:putative ATPase
LPYVERGTIRLIGATTENPSFEIISALLSRCRVYVLQPLSEEQIAALLRRALEDRERGLGAAGIDRRRRCSGTDRQLLQRRLPQRLQHARSRRATGLEGAKHIDTVPWPSEAVQQRVLMYDKSGEEHYNLISALHKSVRNSDPDAALYWLARMFAAGEDPLYLARRVVRMAVEDIGLAAPKPSISASRQRGHRVSRLARRRPGTGRSRRLSLPRAQVELRLHRLRRGPAEIEHTRQEPVPLHLRNAPTES